MEKSNADPCIPQVSNYLIASTRTCAYTHTYMNMHDKARLGFRGSGSDRFEENQIHLFIVGWIQSVPKSIIFSLGRGI